jgi:branched-chain amino acid transport system permease protein
MRAVQYDREMAIGLGIPANAVYFMTFGLGALVAGLGGVLAAPIVVVSFKMGLDILVIAFIVVIVGGLGSIKGSVLSAILIGELEGISSVFVSPVIARVFSLVFMILVLMIRPEGLFGRER